MSAPVRRRSRLVRDACADWRRWSVGERIAAGGLAALFVIGAPVFLIVLGLTVPM